MNWVSQLTEGLANLNIKWVLLSVGIGVLLFTLCRMGMRARQTWLGWVAEHVQVLLSVVVVVFLLIRPFLFQAFYIPSGSMEPTLMGPQTGPDGVSQSGGDRLLVNKLIYRISDPQRFDIAVFKAPPQADVTEKEFIKRVVALPGERVEVTPPRLLLDGRTAVALRGDADNNGFSVTDPDSLGPTLQGRRVELPNYHGSLRVVAAPAPVVRATRTEVVVDGATELSDPTGGIQEGGDLGSLGADPSVRGSLFRVNGEARLLVLEGSALSYEPARVMVNGRVLDERYIKEPPNYVLPPRTLAANEYFVLGDNRTSSNDSHSWGPLTRDRIIGRAEILFWPPGRFNLLHWWLLSLLGGMFAGYNLLQYLLADRHRVRRWHA